MHEAMMITPVAAALLIEVQERARRDPEKSFIDLLADLIKDRPPLPIEEGRSLAARLNAVQALCHPAPGSATLFLGLALPGGQLYIVPTVASMIRLETAITSPLAELGAALGEGMGGSWNTIQSAVALQNAASRTEGLVDPQGNVLPFKGTGRDN